MRRHQWLGSQVLGKVQIRNAKSFFCRSARTPIIQRRKAGNQRPGSGSIPRAPESVDLVSGMPAFTQPQSKAGTNPAQIAVPWIKNPFSWDFHRPKMIKNAHKKCTRTDQKDQTFASATFHRFLP